MTALSSFLDLDDADGLIAADVDGALRSAALAGAQVRATAGDLADIASDRLRDLRPRSVVFVAGEGRAGRAASLLVAAVGARIGVPLVHVPSTPPWVGPLDVVLVSGDDAGDPRLAESTAAAVRRGAETVLVTPDEGPLRAAAAGRALFVPPRIAVREHNSLARYLTAGISVLRAVASESYSPLLPDPQRLADVLDGEASRNHPSHEVFHNPAKSIATRMSGRRVVFTGIGPTALETARHASEVMLRAAGVVASAGEFAEVVAAAIASVVPAPSAAVDYDPFFHDEQLDGPRPEAPVRVLVAASPALAYEAERRTAAVQDAEILSVGSADAGTTIMDTPPARDSGPGELESMALLATRLEMAAAYLSLIGGR